MKSILFSHKGKREINQDFVLGQTINNDSYLFLVADGMGGYEHGEIAAKLVAENVHIYLSTVSYVTEAEIQKAINKANLAVRQLIKVKGTKLGSTIGGVVVQENDAVCFWVGDVKIFHYRNKKLIWNSRSHTLMNEMIENGSVHDAKQINKYKHIVTRSIQGEIAQSQIETFRINSINHSDLILICSDGVHDLIDGIQIQKMLSVNSVASCIQEIENSLEPTALDNYSLISYQPNND